MPEKILEKFKNPQLVKAAVRDVYQLGRKAGEKLGRRPVLMEVCGTHTMTVSKSGLRGMLQDVLELKSGPGCPVCVTAQADIDRIIEISRQDRVTVATFGDMIRVPGSRSTLEKERGAGAAVKMVYSPMEAVSWAAAHPDQDVVLIGVGFETTAPVVAACLRRTASLHLKNFSVLSLHKTMPEVLKKLLADKACGIDGLLLPGHVCAVTGRKPFDFIADFQISAVVAGFEPIDVLGALKILLGRMLRGETGVTNGYRRLVSETGNALAQEMMEQCFVPAEAVWRGLGSIPGSGLELSPTYQFFDAARRFSLAVSPALVPAGCRCGDLLQGKIRPPQCALFGTACTPERPVGPCMVSSEGACAAYHYYERNGESYHE